jgi:hypothetical protein
MKKLLLFALTVIVIVATIIAGCNKIHSIPTLHNIDLSTKPLPEVKAILNGKWQLHYMQGGFCSACQYQRHNEFYTFSDGCSHINWIIDKTVWADTDITWFQQEWINKQINVMEFYAKDQIMHHLSPDRIQNDTLVMYEPGYDGMNYYFTKVK